MSSSAMAFEAVADTLGEGVGVVPSEHLARGAPRGGTPQLNAALAKAQSQIRGVQKNAATGGGKYSYRYSTLAAVWDVCRDPITSNGLALTQIPHIVDGRVVLETRLLHVSGEEISGEWPIDPVKNDPQGLGSATTYARRYSMMAMLGISPDDDAIPEVDDDARSASNRDAATRARSAGLVALLAVISDAPSLDGLRARVEYIKATASGLDPDEVAIAEDAYKRRVDDFDSKKRAAAQRAEIRAGMRKGE